MNAGRSSPVISVRPDRSNRFAQLIDALKSMNPQALYLCDPVIGDSGGLYVPEATAAAIRAHLMPLADVITPNRFELEWLAGKILPDNPALAEAALAFGAGHALVTSAHAMMAGSTGNLLVEKTSSTLFEHRVLDGPSNGLGDLTSALFLGRLLKGETAGQAAERATASVFEMMAVQPGPDQMNCALRLMPLHSSTRWQWCIRASCSIRLGTASHDNGVRCGRLSGGLDCGLARNFGSAA